MTDWLGLSKSALAIGVHIGTSMISMVALRAEPLRIVGVGRRPVPDGAAVSGAAVAAHDPGMPRTLGVELGVLVDRLRLPDGAGAVVAIEPSESSVALLDDRDGGVCTVERPSHDRTIATAHLSGLRLEAIDVVPVALARLARMVTAGDAGLRGAFDWSLRAGPGYLDAERSSRRSGRRLRVGQDLRSVRPLRIDLLPIRVARQLMPVIDLDQDAVALGAALAWYDLPPIAEVRPLNRRIPPSHRKERSR